MSAEPMRSNACATTQKCLTCGNDYQPTKSWQRFCGPVCRNKHHHGKRTVEALAKRVDALEKQVELIRGAFGAVRA